MKVANLNQLPLLDLWYENSDDRKWKVNIPFAPKFPLWSGIETEQSNVIFFELEPGCALGEHKESEEEILYVISGKAEVSVGDERREVSEGGLIVIPPETPHYVRNIGEQSARFLGFFPAVHHVSTFSEKVLPIGAKVL